MGCLCFNEYTKVLTFKLSPSLPGNAKTLTVDGSESQTVLPNLTPGVTYEVTVVALKGQRESEPGSDSVTTGVEITFPL